MRFQTTRPDVLETRYGSKLPNIVFAVLCWMVGIPALLAALGAFGWEAEAPPAAGFLLGFGLIAGGVGFLTYRRGFVVDRSRGLLMQWRSVFGLRWKHAMRLSEITQVVLRCERRERGSSRGGSSDYTVYPIWIDGRGESLKFEDAIEEDDARQTAEHVAETLGVPLIDRSENVVRKHEWL